MSRKTVNKRKVAFKGTRKVADSGFLENKREHQRMMCDCRAAQSAAVRTGWLGLLGLLKSASDQRPNEDAASQTVSHVSAAGLQIYTSFTATGEAGSAYVCRHYKGAKRYCRSFEGQTIWNFTIKNKISKKIQLGSADICRSQAKVNIWYIYYNYV